MRVGLDGRAFTSPAGGVRRYVRGLVQGLLELGEPIELVALGGDRAAIPADLAYVPEPLHPPKNFGWMLFGVPIAASRARVDLIHAPAYTAPMWATVPVVLTIHDVSYQRHPEWFPYRRDSVRRLFYRRSARTARHILTDSTFSASEIAAAYGVPPDRLTVAPLGVDPSFGPGPASDAEALPAGVRAPFVLHVGDLHTRRNLAVVLDALLAIRGRPGMEHLSLVMAGIDRGTGEEVLAAAARAGVPDLVVRLGPVAEAELRGLYRAATALVYPSRYEGFGLPVLEAMASGTPVIASRAASMPEVLGDAGLLIEPLDTGAWAEAIARVAGDAELRARMRASGLRRAAGFTWANTARATMDVYRRVLETS